MSLAGCQINLIDVNFHLQKSFTSKKVWKFLIKTQLTKSDPKNIREWKVSSLMPIRANSWDSSGNIWSVPLFGKISRCDMAKIALHWFVSTGRTQLICAKKRQRPSFFRCAPLCNGFKSFLKKNITGGPPLTRFSLPRIPLPRFLAYVRERPLMTSDFRIGRGVQNDPKNRTF